MSVNFPPLCVNSPPLSLNSPPLSAGGGARGRLGGGHRSLGAGNGTQFEHPRPRNAGPPAPPRPGPLLPAVHLAAGEQNTARGGGSRPLRIRLPPLGQPPSEWREGGREGEGSV
eukprot:759616-Prorocentrum_minimum.AAC.1